MQDDCRDEMWHALESYGVALERSNLAKGTKTLYMAHAMKFVRWIEGRYDPNAARRRLPDGTRE